jgi:hypothetical protein
MIRPAVVRIGHRQPSRFLAERQEQPRPIVMAARRDALQVAQVLFVHRQQQVEAAEILDAHLPRAQSRDVITAAARRLDGAPVRWRADVVIGGTGRIELQAQVRRLAFGQVPRHAFRRG